MKEYKEATGQLLFLSRRARTQKYCTEFGKIYLKVIKFWQEREFGKLDNNQSPLYFRKLYKNGVLKYHY